MELWKLDAREQIRDLVARYNANGDSGRIDPVLKLFTADAKLDVVGSRSYRGHEEIRALLSGAAASSETSVAPAHLRHFTSTHQIDFDDAETARGRCYYQVLTGEGVDHWGLYVDAYRRVGERWFFQSRVVSVDGAVPGGWGERTAQRLSAGS